ncbi:CpsB/CapC family capsule biosynthesis tyrosine phosphatase [uncultured Polaribacter sp.]|uniref:tyrosine-protein phosphatase n=1 Tax=uncultured Polaribacter sp. TaxID=174711 RepID=UPI00259BC1A0|nr:CpsB/CapC family capsule biosynthesis tyrosine phosphatase [uncultured Polaribacter sp.]
MFFFKKKEIPINEFFPENFVDIHSHLLPGIDDGAKDLNNSIELILKMRSYGIKNFITTPHVLGSVYPNSSETIKMKLKEVQEELKKRKITDVSLGAAAEYMLDEEFSVLLEKDDILTLKDNLVLVEMSYFNAPNNLFEVLFELGLKGYKPILAHPERYIFYHNNLRMYTKLKNAGCLFQLNLLSLTEKYGKNVQKTSLKLLEEGMYHYVGTDVHNIEHIRLLKDVSNKKTLHRIELLLENNSKFYKKSAKN